MTSSNELSPTAHQDPSVPMVQNLCSKDPLLWNNLPVSI